MNRRKAQKIWAWLCARRKTLGTLLVCGLLAFAGLGAGALSFFAPLPFMRDVYAYNRALENVLSMDENSQIQGVQTLQHLWQSSENATIREASAYNVGTLLGMADDPTVLTISENALKDAVRMDPADEDAKRNLEIVILRYGLASQGQGNEGQGENMPTPSNSYGHSAIPDDL